VQIIQFATSTFRMSVAESSALVNADWIPACLRENDNMIEFCKADLKVFLNI